MIESSTSAILNDPLWFPGTAGPLFGWLSRPAAGEVRGGVVLASTVGFEARSARIALRSLSRELAASGFAVLRFDYSALGDSAGDFGSVDPNQQWPQDVASAVRYLRDASVDEVSVVGIRLGATIAAVAAQRHELDLGAVVLWDPCESGRSYLRELRALEALRRTEFSHDDSGVVETGEFLFHAEMAASLKAMSVASGDGAPLAERTLAVARRSRPLSEAFLAKIASPATSTRVSDEVEILLSTHPFFAQTPEQDVKELVAWLSEGPASSSSAAFALADHAVVGRDEGGAEIVERAIFLGPRRLFGIVTEPAGAKGGPWIVMYPGIHEDHTGPSRFWVELSRQWSSRGLRCLRLDVSGLGETARAADEAPVRQFDPLWVRDVATVGPALDEGDPSNVVYLGMCSAGFLAVESALASGARGLCLVNPFIGVDVVHFFTSLENSSSPVAHRVAAPLRRLHESHHWWSALLWQICHFVLPRRMRVNVMERIIDKGCDVFVLGSADDLSPYPKVPILRSIEGRRHGHARPYPFILVPELDHDLTFAVGRAATAELLEEHVRRVFAPVDDPSEGNLHG